MKKFFATDWEAMTAQDWIGTILAVLLFVLMAVVYVYALRPGNKKRMQERGRIIFNGDELEEGGKNGGA